MDNQQVTKEEIGWLAGIIDGEGTVGMYYQNKKKYHTINPSIEIVNTDPSILNKIMFILVRLDCTPYIQTKKHNVKLNPNWKLSYNLKIQKQIKLRRLIPIILPYLTGIKKYKADLILQFLLSRMNKGKPSNKDYTEYEHKLIDEFRNLRDYTLDTFNGEDIVQAYLKE